MSAPANGTEQRLAPQLSHRIERDINNGPNLPLIQSFPKSILAGEATIQSPTKESTFLSYSNVSSFRMPKSGESDHCSGEPLGSWRK